MMNRHRIFLLTLVFFLLIVQSLLRSAAVATPFSGTTLPGGFTFWELRGQLPTGVAAAALTAVLAGAGCQIWQGLRMLGRYSAPAVDRAAGCGLWCGWPLLACCFSGLGYILPEPAPLPIPLPYMVNGSLVLLVACRFVSRRCHPAAGCFCVLAALTALLVPGWLYADAEAEFICAVLLLTAGGLCFPRRRVVGLLLLVAGAILTGYFVLRLSAVAENPRPAACIMAGTLLCQGILAWLYLCRHR